MDVLESIAAEEGWRIEFVPGTWDALLREVEDGEIDLLVPVSRAHERPGLEFGGEPLLSTWGQVFAAEDAGVETLLQLDGQRVAVVREDAFGRELAGLLREFSVDFELVETASSSDAFDAVVSGKADVVAVERIDGNTRAHAHGLRPSPIVFHPTAARFVAPSGVRTHLDAIDRALVRQKADPSSAYHAAFELWLGKGPAASVLPSWVVPVLIAVAAALALALLFLAVLRSRVAAATAELRNEAARREAVEEQLREAQKMEAVGQLAAGVAHDFNNLLTVIHNCVDLMGDEDSELRDEASLAVKEAAARAGALTRQLLVFARRQSLHLTVVDLNPLLDRLAPLLRGALREDVRLTLDLATEAPAVEVDTGQLEQVLLNLVVNARDAMPDGGHLRISTARFENFAEIRVKDDGVGMSEETRKRVFEPFFTTKQRRGGTGLGLAVVYGIVRQSGGRVEIESERGTGTTVRLLLPVAEEESEVEVADESAPAAASSDLRVLLVDDDAGVRSSVAQALRRRGLHVEVAASGEEALAFATRSSRGVDVVVTDVVMPGMKGPELARRLSALGFDAPLLFTSGAAAEDVAGIGAEYLRKPYTTDHLVGRIQKLARGDEDAAAQR